MAHDGDSKICRITHIISIRKKRKYYVSASKKRLSLFQREQRNLKKLHAPIYLD